MRPRNRWIFIFLLLAFLPACCPKASATIGVEKNTGNGLEINPFVVTVDSKGGDVDLLVHEKARWQTFDANGIKLRQRDDDFWTFYKFSGSPLATSDIVRAGPANIGASSVVDKGRVIITKTRSYYTCGKVTNAQVPSGANHGYIAVDADGNAPSSQQINHDQGGSKSNPLSFSGASGSITNPGELRVTLFLEHDARWGLTPTADWKVEWSFKREVTPTAVLTGGTSLYNNTDGDQQTGPADGP